VNVRFRRKVIIGRLRLSLYVGRRMEYLSVDLGMGAIVERREEVKSRTELSDSQKRLKECKQRSEISTSRRKEQKSVLS
jgi:hypothetical protein